MKTIEEKVNKYVDSLRIEYDESDRDTILRVIKSIRDALVYVGIKLATEQKEIDTKEFMEESLEMLKAERERVKAEMIDKACEWLMGWFRDSKYYTMEASIDMLRKAMEE